MEDAFERIRKNRKTGQQRGPKDGTLASRAYRDSSLRYLLITEVLLLSLAAFAGDKPASCKLVGKSVVSRSSSGLAQVSNLGDIQITCSVPARPYSWGDTRIPLKVATIAYKILPDGSKKLVASETNQTGSRFGTQEESVYFHVHIPLEPEKRDAEATRFLTKLEKSMPHELSEDAHQRALERLREFVYQQRVGHFVVECRILDREQVMGIGLVELEVLFKGRFSDAGLPGFSPA